MAALNLATTLLAEGGDPITDVVNHDWAALGGWSLFIGLVITLLMALFREGLVPGKRVVRLEGTVERQQELIRDLTEQNGKLIEANEIAKHFFEETAPRRGDVRT